MKYKIYKLLLPYLTYFKEWVVLKEWRIGKYVFDKENSDVSTSSDNI